MTATSPPAMPMHGGQLRQIAARFGVDAAHLLDFSANINPAGPPSGVVAALRCALADPATLTTYPDFELPELKRTLASNAGVSPANISVANGFVPLLEAALRSLQISRCLLPLPSFSEYRRALENADVSVLPFQLSAAQNFRYDPQTIVNACLDRGADAILLANPQNPSGVLCHKPQMTQLIEIAVRHRLIVLLDEAFVDYCPAHSLTCHAVEYERMIVFRSLTKFFAIPGLRVAYAISHSSHATELNRRITPWPITAFASNAVCAALQDREYAEASRHSNEHKRTSLKQELARLHITVYPSRTNFLLLGFQESIDVERLWEMLIVDHHVVLRCCSNFEGLPRCHLRTAVRSEPENQRLIHALDRALPDTQV